MEISTREAYGVQIVDMKGRLDSRTAGPSSDKLVQIAKGDNKQVLINLGELEFITSAGLRVLLVAAKLLQNSGGALKLCNANEMVQQVLETSGFNSLLHLYPTEADAIKSF